MVSAGHYDYTSGSDSTDYFGVSTSTYNTTVMGDDQLFGGYTFFTPRLNFTRNVSESFYGANNGSYSYFSWKTPLNFSSSLVVRNGTTVISSTNYSLRNISANAWVLDWKVSTYNATLVNVYFNRTFIKNVDDLIVSPSDIYLGATSSSFFVVTPPITTYGEDATFQFNGVSAGNLGPYVNVSDWAVGWDYTNRTFVADSNGTANCSDSEHNLWILIPLIILVGFLLYGVAMIPTSGFLDIAKVILLAVALMIAVNLLSILRTSC